MSEKTHNRRTHAKRPLTDVARKLRRNQTEAEGRLWYHFRDRRFLGYKFRRQTPRGRAVADFLCHEARLIVEVDGGQHAGSSTDIERTAFSIPPDTSFCASGTMTCCRTRMAFWKRSLER